MATMPRLSKNDKQVEVPQGLIGDSARGAYVACPSCGRPVADGLVRCPGCGMRILLGVAASRALLFLTTGAVLGLLVGGVSVGWIMSGRASAGAPAAIVVQASPTPGETPAPSAAGQAPIDPLAASALRQVASTDAQLAGSVVALKHELRTKSIDTAAIAATLREMSAAATYGTSVVGYLSAWPEAATLQGRLGPFYTQIRAVAANGLAATLASGAAYQAAANQMITVLGALPTIQAAEHSLADSGGIDLPAGSTSVASPGASN